MSRKFWTWFSGSNNSKALTWTSDIGVAPISGLFCRHRRHEEGQGIEHQQL
ncbi:hypothetical protein L208DRAFT_1389524 [Tricholoma matsutake]|nr:hypothetical protein L208DRAFT_1389524 [Tricholoma matsutake 945]